MPVAQSLVLLLVLAVPQPSHQDVEAWIGAFTAGPETLSFHWADGFLADLGRIRVPVDGRWHETVATFAVRHRLTWDPRRGSILLEEQHNEGAHWRYELRLSDDGRRLEKLELPIRDGAEKTLVRSYRRRDASLHDPRRPR